MPLWVKKGTLRFPEDKRLPVVMVGPGTGVAPFRAALQERVAQGKTGWRFTFLAWLLSSDLISHTHKHTHPLTLLLCSANVLFFGCRSESKDFYFRSEWEEMTKTDHLTLFTAFSRDQVTHTLSSWKF